jgi:hypothetical protein
MTKAIDILKSDLDPATIPDEWVLERVRNWRNVELIKSDWTQVQDSPVDKAAWATYRQALRDLPTSNADPRQIELPAQPGGN